MDHPAIKEVPHKPGTITWLRRLKCAMGAVCLMVFLAPGPTGAVETFRGDGIDVVSEGVKPRFAEDVLSDAEKSYRFVTEKLGHRPEDRVTIFLTSTDRRFQDLTGRILPEWGVAAAMPGGRIVVSPLEGQTHDLDRILAHEIVHAVMNDGARGRCVPRWFHEGCAQYLSGEWGVRNRLYMVVKVVRGELMTFEDIQNVFSAGYADAGLAYDQSMLAVRRLVGKYGEKVLPAILRGMGEGVDFAGAFHDATGLWPSEYERDYLVHVRKTYGKRSLYTAIPGTWTAILMLAVIVYLIKRRRNKRLMQQWDVVEAAENIIQFPDGGRYD